MGFAPTLIAPQYAEIIQRQLIFQRPLNLFRQHRCIQQPQVDALPRQRMNGVGGITDQGHTGLNVIHCVILHQWKSKAAVGFQHLTQALLKGVAETLPEGVVGEFHNRLQLIFIQRPDDGRETGAALVGGFPQRQKRQRPAFQKHLPGGVAVGLFSTHGGDDGALSIGPGATTEPQLVPHPGTGTVGTDQQGGGQLAAVRQHNAPTTLLAVQNFFQPDSAYFHIRRPLHPLVQGVGGDAVFDDVPQVFRSRLIGVELDIAGTIAVPNVHMGKGRHPLGGHAIPYTQAAQDVFRGLGQGTDPGIKAVRPLLRTSR